MMMMIDPQVVLTANENEDYLIKILLRQTRRPEVLGATGCDVLRNILQPGVSYEKTAVDELRHRPEFVVYVPEKLAIMCQ